MKKPNIVYIFADQWRASAVGYAGDPNVITPYIDSLFNRSISFKNAVSNCPICTPYRASLLTGQYPLSTGMFANDLCLNPDAKSIAKVCKNADYNTAYIGKWHIDGHGRSAFIPPERRQGFDYWKVLECTHDYNNSIYYGDTPELMKWDGYDAYAQTDDAVKYISDYSEDKPFLLVVSYGTPHNPYDSAPEELKALYPPDKLILPPNIDKSVEEDARRDLCGYYAHITAIDSCAAKIEAALKDKNLDDNTIFVLTSDHGDCVYSHTDKRFPNINKQRPYDESVLVPFLVKYPNVTGNKHKEISTPICTPDIIPTLLELAGLDIPDSVEGASFASEIKGTGSVEREGVVIASYMPFADFSPAIAAESYEYRGIRTTKYTYVKDINGARMLFDNQNDPYQMNNLVNDPKYAEIKQKLEIELATLLREQNDDFLPAKTLAAKYGYHDLDKYDDIPYDKEIDWYSKQHELMMDFKNL